MSPVSPAEARRVWARVAAQSFGGPAAQIAVMHRVVVDEQKWLSEERFLHALNFCMLLPGPEAQQLATYIGWLMHGVRGGLVAGGLFVLPGFLSILALSWIYAAFGQVGWVEGAFFGVKAAVLAVVVEALLRIGKRVLKGRWQVALAAAAFLGISLLDVPFPLIVLGAGLLGALRPSGPGAPFSGPRPRLGATLRTAALWGALWLVPLAVLRLALGPDSVYVQVGTFFSKAAVVTFGGAYSVLAYVAQQAVERFGWLQPGEMLQGLGLAETTPGPLIQVVQFVGYLAAWRSPGALPPWLAGLCGAVLTTWVTFVPCFLWIFTGAPWVERLRGEPRLASALQAISSAVVGAVLHLGLWSGLHTLFGALQVRSIGPGLAVELPVGSSFDGPAALIALGAGLWLLVLHRGMASTLGLAVLAGLGLHFLGLR